MSSRDGSGHVATLDHTQIKRLILAASAAAPGAPPLPGSDICGVEPTNTVHPPPRPVSAAPPVPSSQPPADPPGMSGAMLLEQPPANTAPTLAPEPAPVAAAPPAQAPANAPTRAPARQANRARDKRVRLRTAIPPIPVYQRPLPAELKRPRTRSPPRTEPECTLQQTGPKSTINPALQPTGPESTVVNPAVVAQLSLNAMRRQQDSDPRQKYAPQSRKYRYKRDPVTGKRQRVYESPAAESNAAATASMPPSVENVQLHGQQLQPPPQPPPPPQPQPQQQQHGGTSELGGATSSVLGLPVIEQQHVAHTRDVPPNPTQSPTEYAQPDQAPSHAAHIGHHSSTNRISHYMAGSSAGKASTRKYQDRRTCEDCQVVRISSQDTLSSVVVISN
jgi:hypothetical protein